MEEAEIERRAKIVGVGVWIRATDHPWYKQGALDQLSYRPNGVF